MKTNATVSLFASFAIAMAVACGGGESRESSKGDDDDDSSSDKGGSDGKSKDGGSGGSNSGGSGSGGSSVGGSGGSGSGGSSVGGSGGSENMGGMDMGGMMAMGGNMATGGVPDIPGLRTKYDFEDGTQLWQISSLQRNQTGITIETAGDQVMGGNMALAITIDTDGTDPTGMNMDGDSKYVGVVSPPDFDLMAGQVVTFHIYVPADAPIHGVQPFLMTTDGLNTSWNWFGDWQEGADMMRDAWVQGTVTYPDNGEQFWEIGVQFIFSGPWQGTVYVDEVSWQ